MITWKNRRPTGKYQTDANGRQISVDDGEIYGTSADTKPTQGVENGALFVEVDTWKMYLFDAASGTWTENGGGA